MRLDGPGLPVIGVPCPGVDEPRPGLVPSDVRRLTDRGRSVVVEAGAGARCLLPDGDYAAAGATIVPEAWGAETLVTAAFPPLLRAVHLRAGTTILVPAGVRPRPCAAGALQARGVAVRLVRASDRVGTARGLQCDRDARRATRWSAAASRCLLADARQAPAIGGRSTVVMTGRA